MSNLLIREAERADAQGIATVHVATWQTTYKGFFPDQYLNDLSIDKRSAFWVKVIESGSQKTLVALEGDQIIGFASFGKSRDFEDMGELYSLYVLSDHQRMRIGSMLWKSVIEATKSLGFAKIHCWSLAENKIAHAVYTNWSGTPTSRVKEEHIGGISIFEREYVWDIVA